MKRTLIMTKHYQINEVFKHVRLVDPDARWLKFDGVDGWDVEGGTVIRRVEIHPNVKNIKQRFWSTLKKVFFIL
jgi:hypothetical protein